MNFPLPFTPSHLSTTTSFSFQPNLPLSLHRPMPVTMLKPLFGFSFDISKKKTHGIVSLSKLKLFCGLG